MITQHEFVGTLRYSPRLCYKYLVPIRKENLQCDVANWRVNSKIVNGRVAIYTHNQFGKVPRRAV